MENHPKNISKKVYVVINEEVGDEMKIWKVSIMS